MQYLWVVHADLAERNRLKDFNKRHPREYAACFVNLEHVVELLNRFGNVGAFQVGYFRSEGGNVYRVGQTGVKHAVETRLYVYVYTKESRLYLLTIGDKSQQAEDIKRCKETVKRFERGVDHG